MDEAKTIGLFELWEGITKTRRFLVSRQESDGHWVAELEGDILLESETILLLTYLKEEGSDLARQCGKTIRSKQLPDGGWEMYPGAGADVTNSVKAYFALKILGEDPSSEEMRRARQKIMELGGADRVNSFTRFYLALLGQIPYDCTPVVPPQMMLLPDRFPINIYSMSSWSRTIFVPLSIVSALQPRRELPETRGIRELFIESPDKWQPTASPGSVPTLWSRIWSGLFRRTDILFQYCRRLGFTPFRKRGIEKARIWTLEHFRDSDGPGAIYPPIVWSWIALNALGYPDDSPAILECRHQLEALILGDAERENVRLQPCMSPVWDTSLTLKALLLSGLKRDNTVIEKGLNWLQRQQILIRGDWSKRVDAKSAGWAFEYHNPFYPDCDDTAMALMVLNGTFPDAAEMPSETKSVEIDEVFVHQTEADSRRILASERGLLWLFAMQNKNGSWAAFDRNNSLEILCHVPFADHNAMIDPGTPDITGRVLESLGRQGFRVNHGNRAIDRAVAFLRKSQCADGSWFGRWGVNHIYGTWQALTGLAAVGVSPTERVMTAGANWLLTHQQADGGWGESPRSYQNAKDRGCGTSTASQTAWAVMGLLAAGLCEHSAVIRGIQFLLKNQKEDGTWAEPEYTGTGFPQVFYLKYHFYPIYFPLMAISLFTGRRQKNDESQDSTTTDLSSGAAPKAPFTDDALADMVMNSSVSQTGISPVDQTEARQKPVTKKSATRKKGFLGLSLYRNGKESEDDTVEDILPYSDPFNPIPRFHDYSAFSGGGILPLWENIPGDSVSLMLFDPESETAPVPGIDIHRFSSEHEGNRVKKRPNPALVSMQLNGNEGDDSTSPFHVFV